jgi:sterol 3beta-glucosyltransferase
MKISIVTVGSRGDVQPYIALGVGLKKAGHEVTFGAHAQFEGFVQRAGLRFVPLNFLPPYDYWNLFPECSAALKGAELAIAAHLAFMTATPYCEKFGIPLLAAYLQTIEPNFKRPMFRTDHNGDPYYKTADHKKDAMKQMGSWTALWRAVNEIRKDLSMEPIPVPTDSVQWASGGRPILYGFSPSVVPPAHWENANAKVTGYWFLDEVTGLKPPAPLVDFLNEGPRPIFIGFSSIPTNKNIYKATDFFEALKYTGQRAVMFDNLVDINLDDLPPNVMLVRDVPYEWLFAQCAAAVHHGGHGTLAWALRTNTPSVIIPCIGDNYFWASLAYHLNVSTKPINFHSIDVKELSEAIMQAVESQEMKTSLAYFSEKICAEDGVGEAVRFIESML